MSTSQEQNRTVFVGGLELWMDQAYLKATLGMAGLITHVKVVSERSVSPPKQYAFVEYSTHEEARNVIEMHAGETFVTGDGYRLKIGWSQRTGTSLGSRDPNEVSLYIGNLDLNVKEDELKQLFATRYSSVTSSKIITDGPTNASKGFGFVRFSDAREAELALVLMQGAFCGSRPIRVRPSTKHCTDGQFTNSLRGSGDPFAGQIPPPPSTPPPATLAPTGHLVYFAGLDVSLTEHDVLLYFQTFGTVYRGTAYAGTGAGVVEFRDFESAELAMRHLQGNNVPARWVDGKEACEAISQCCLPQYPAAAAPCLPQYLAAPALAPAACYGAAPFGAMGQSAPPVITNMTMAQAQSELDRAGAKDAPSIEHFQELLRDPCFVQAFEQQLAQGPEAGGAGGLGAGGLGRAPYAPAKMPWLLQDRPELFELPASVERMNEDYLPSPGSPGACGRLFPSLSFAPLLPCEVGLA